MKGGKRTKGEQVRDRSKRGLRRNEPRSVTDGMFRHPRLAGQFLARSLLALHYRSDNADAPDDGLPGFEVEMREAREEYVACKLLCETAYCVSICDRQYQEKVQDMLR